MKHLSIILLLASVSQAVTVSSPYGADYWLDMELAIDNNPLSFAYEQFPAAHRPLQITFENEISSLPIIALGDYEVRYLLGDNWHTDDFYSDSTHLQLPYSVNDIRITSTNSFQQLKIYEVPEPATVLILLFGFLLSRPHHIRPS